MSLAYCSDCGEPARAHTTGGCPTVVSRVICTECSELRAENARLVQERNDCEFQWAKAEQSLSELRAIPQLTLRSAALQEEICALLTDWYAGRGSLASLSQAIVRLIQQRETT